MNKRLITIIISCITILLTFLMVIFSAFRAGHPKEVFGQELGLKEINYQLAHPGILPDSPFYWLKMIRDRIWGSLIRQPQQKTSWLLLMADKRLAAAEKLIEKNQAKLALTTVSKAEKYLEKSINEFKNLSTGQQLDLRENLQQAVSEHEQKIKNMANKIDGHVKHDLEALLIYPQGFKSSLLN